MVPCATHSHLVLLSSTSNHHSFKCLAVGFVELLPKNRNTSMTGRMLLFVHGIQACTLGWICIITKELVVEFPTTGMSTPRGSL